MATRRATINTYKEGNVSSPNLTQPTKLTSHEVEERRKMGLYFNFNKTYIKGYKCNEKTLFYIDCEEEKDPKI